MPDTLPLHRYSVTLEPGSDIGKEPRPFLMHYVYILHSTKLDRFYVGESADPHRRVKFHRAGRERYSARADDWVLVFVKTYTSRSEALVAEKKIKSAKSRVNIKRWINGPDNEISATCTISEHGGKPTGME